MKSLLKSFALFILLLTILFQQRGSSGSVKAAEAVNPHAGQSVGAQQDQVVQTVTIATPALIEQAFIRGEITANERLLYLSYALYEPQSLPSQFHSNVGWYGTQYVREVQAFLQSVNAASADAVHQQLSRMSTLASTVCDAEDGANAFDSTNFHFSYGTIGGGLAIADYVTSMEATFNIEVTQFGWAKPPLNANNPFGRFPIQIFALGGGLYGYVAGGGGGNYTGFIGDNPNTPATETNAVSSCMVLNDDFSQFPEGTQGALDSTTSHEFVHAIQNGYGDPGGYEDSMWYESAAAYMEDEIFDSANSDYQYLWPVATNCLGEWPDNGAPGGVSQYSNFLFFRHVAEQNGGTNVAGGGEDVMQHAWENIGAGQPGLTAYNNALVTEGTNLPDAFHTYAIAAKYSKACGTSYAAPYCFEEGVDYVSFVGGVPSVQGTIAANPGSFNGSVKNHYAVNWVTLPTSGSPYEVTLSNTATGGQLRGSLVCDTGSVFMITPFAAVVGAGAATNIASFSATGCTSVVAVITNQEQLSGDPNSCTSNSYTIAVSAAVATPTPTNTPIVPTPTATNTATNTPIGPTATATNTATNTPGGPTATATATPTNTPIGPTATATATPTNTPVGPTTTATNTPTNTPVGPTATATATSTAIPTASGEQLYISSSLNGRVDTLLYRDEDILLYERGSDQWTMVFDGSDVGVANADLDSFDLLADGNILMSFDRPIRFPTLGLVDDSDIVKFIPTTLGLNTSGTFSLFFDGSAVDLTTGSEDIDAISYMDDGTLLISTYGMANVGTVEAHDEDLLRFSPTALVTTTAGSWELYFDGSVVGLEAGSEDLGAAASDAVNKLYLATKGNFAAASQNQIEGESNDIFGCTLSTPGLNSTTCSFFAFFNGNLARFNHPIDGFSVGTATTFTMLRSAASPEAAGPEGDEPVQFEVLPDEPVLDDEEFDRFDTAQMDETIQGDVQIFLPLIER